MLTIEILLSSFQTLNHMTLYTCQCVHSPFNFLFVYYPQHWHYMYWVLLKYFNNFEMHDICLEPWEVFPTFFPYCFTNIFYSAYSHQQRQQGLRSDTTQAQEILPPHNTTNNGGGYPLSIYDDHDCGNR